MFTGEQLVKNEQRALHVFPDSFPTALLSLTDIPFASDLRNLVSSSSAFNTAFDDHTIMVDKQYIIHLSHMDQAQMTKYGHLEGKQLDLPSSQRFRNGFPSGTSTLFQWRYDWATQYWK